MFAQQIELIFPPAFVDPTGRIDPSPLVYSSVSPVDEYEEDDEEAVEEELPKGLFDVHQSKPSNDPPKPTVPIFEKST